MNILIYGRHTATRVKSTRLSINSMLQYLGISEYFNVKTVVSSDLKDKCWLSNARLLIMPGVYNDGEHLEDKTVENIRHFIESGGSYLGMCAGAYTSCNDTLYKSMDMKVDGKGKIDIFPGRAVGSVYYPVCFHTTFNSRMVPVNCFDSTSSWKGELYALYNGGPEFVPDKNFTDYQTIATYTDYPAKKAIVKREMGKGRILLSGVYPILNIEYIKQSEFSEAQRAKMEMYRGDQRKLWIIFLKYLLNIDSIARTWKRSRDSYDS